jgi:hypothetical protein
LQQEVTAALAPLHGLLLYKPLIHHVIDGGFDKAGSDCFFTSVQFSVVGNVTRWLKQCFAFIVTRIGALLWLPLAQ